MSGSSELGATFTHIADKVTFETLLAQRRFAQAALQWSEELVHYFDVWAHQPPEASRVECVLMGLRKTYSDDDELLLAANQVFGSRYTNHKEGK